MTARRNRDFWEKIVAELEGGELTHEQFAERRRVNVGSLRSWLYRLRRERGGGRVLAVGFEEAITGRGPAPSVVEISFDGGVARVSVGTDVEYVAELIARLRARLC